MHVAPSPPSQTLVRSCCCCPSGVEIINRAGGYRSTAGRPPHQLFNVQPLIDRPSLVSTRRCSDHTQLSGQNIKAKVKASGVQTAHRAPAKYLQSVCYWSSDFHDLLAPSSSVLEIMCKQGRIKVSCFSQKQLSDGNKLQGDARCFTQQCTQRGGRRRREASEGKQGKNTYI